MTSNTWTLRRTIMALVLRRKHTLALLGSLAGWVALLCTAGAVMAGARFDFEPDAAQAALLVVHVRDELGQSVPARVRVAHLGSFDARQVRVAAEGRVELRLAAGEYRLWASHGPEWSVADVSLQLRAAERRQLALTLARQVERGDYRGCDLHVHTDASHDSHVSFAERDASAAAEGLQVAVVSDHNHVTQLPDLSTSNVSWVRGVEVTTWEPELGHFNVFPSTSAPAYKHATPERLLAALPPRAARFVQVNHPRLMQHIGYFELAGKHGVLHAMRHGFDGLEVWNGYDLHRPRERDRVLADWLQLIAHGKRVVATGGSDSHDLARTVIGYPRSYVQRMAAGDDGSAVAAALREGRAFVSNGPILELQVAGHKPGETVRLTREGAPRVRVTLRVDAPLWMDLTQAELWVDGKRVRVLTIPAWTKPDKQPEEARAHFVLDLPLTKARSVLAMVRGTRAMDELFDQRTVVPFAFTNPVWLER